jgi:hypothetical protein
MTNARTTSTTSMTWDLPSKTQLAVFYTITATR